MLTQFIAACPYCGRQMKASPEQVGLRVRCNGCQKVFRIAASSDSGREAPVLASAAAAMETPAPTAAAALETQAPAGRQTDSAPLTTIAPDSAPELPSARIGRFALRQVLGQGAFGRVFRAHDPQLDRYVALKVPTFGPDDKDKIQRFLTEAKAAARLRHPNIVPTYESGQIDGQYFIASQFVAGDPLGRRLKENPPNFRQAAEWARQLAGALAYAHGEGVIHRDIKPDNIMLDEQGVPQIMDFGLAKRLNEDSGMTTDGTILGTPAYMSPEQARGDAARVGPASDQYNLGVVLYEMLGGRRPFAGPPHTILAQVLTDEPPAPRTLRPEIPADLEAICLKAIRKHPAARYASAADLALDLGRWLSGDVTVARPISAAERSARWARQHAVAVALAAMFLLVAVLGVAVIALVSTSQPGRIAPERGGLVASPPQLPAEDGPAHGEQPTTGEPDKDPHAPNTTAGESDGLAASPPATPPSAEPLSSPPSASSPSTPPPAYRDELAPLRTERESQYREHLAAARRHLADNSRQTAAEELGKCDPELRGWEWRYWMARVRGGEVMSFSRAPGRIDTLRLSPDGRHVLAGGRRMSDSGRTHWNAIYAWGLRPDAGQKETWLELPGVEGGPGLGRVCAFSRDGKQIRSVWNQPSRGTATPFLWEWRDKRRPPQRPEPAAEIEGYALDCGQTASGEWLVLTAAAAKSQESDLVRLQLPITIHRLESKQQTSIAADELYAAALSPDLSAAHVLARRGGQTCWIVLPFSTGQEQSRPVGPPLVARPLWASDDEESLSPWRPNQSSQMAFAGGSVDSPGGLVVLNEQPAAELRLPVGPVGATFDASGTRLLAVRGDVGGLLVYNTKSATPTKSLSPIPLLGGAGSEAQSVIVELGHTPDQIAIAIDDALTILDVTSGR